MQSFFRNILIAAALLAVPLAGTAQNAAAFLSVVPDARSAAMGGAGVALSADVFSALRNAAQLPFSEERFGAGYSYLPWMRDLTPRTALHTAAVYFKPDGKQAVSASFRYFSQYGSERTDEEGNVLGRLEPHDMAFDVGYSRTVAEGLSVALTARYVRSEPGADDVAQTFAVDAGLFYRHAVAASHRVTFGFQAANVGGPRLRRRKPSAAVGVEGGRSRGTRIFRSARPDTDRRNRIPPAALGTPRLVRKFRCRIPLFRNTRPARRLPHGGSQYGRIPLRLGRRRLSMEICRGGRRLSVGRKFIPLAQYVDTLRTIQLVMRASEVFFD